MLYLFNVIIFTPLHTRCRCAICAKVRVGEKFFILGKKVFFECEVNDTTKKRKAALKESKDEKERKRKSQGRFLPSKNGI